MDAFLSRWQPSPHISFFFQAGDVKQMVNACSRASTVCQWMLKYVWACVCIHVSVRVLVYIFDVCIWVCLCLFFLHVFVCVLECVCSGLCHSHTLPVGTSCKAKPSWKHWAFGWSSSASVCRDDSLSPHLIACHQSVAASVFAPLSRLI